MENERAHNLLAKIYGHERSASLYQDLTSLLRKYRGKIPAPRVQGLSERDAVLITYPDQVREGGRATLVSLAEFCEAYLRGIVTSIHILPFYPSSSDDGFSVVNYVEVAPEYGAWSDVKRLGGGFRLMFDAVINHASAHSQWFQQFLNGNPAHRDDFIEVRGHPDLASVVRPRALPLLTHFGNGTADKEMWTTFGPDQVDLNYHNPAVLLQVLDILLFYASQGAEFIRLDAIAYLWKEPGTSCIHLPQTHWIVQLMRAVLSDVAPNVMLITETNVPNLENLSYFGDGTNEAQLVYNFPLPPLVLYTLRSGNASPLSEWASSLRLPSPGVTFLNFLASHDGLGLNPVRGILQDREIEELARETAAEGGFISTKTNVDGTQSPYELNINYLDALRLAGDAGEADNIRRFVAAHAILLAMRGVPAIYFHSLFGSRGWLQGVEKTGMNRSINREKLKREELQAQLASPGSVRAQVFGQLSQLMRLRASEACFSPDVPQRVLEIQPGFFALMREPAGTDTALLCVQNVTSERRVAQFDLSGSALGSASGLRELIGGKPLPAGGMLTLEMAPYESAWITNTGKRSA